MNATVRDQVNRSRRLVEAEENLVIDFQYSLIDALKERGMSKEDLANALGVSKARVSQWLSDGANPTLKTVAKIFDAIDCRLPFEPRSVWEAKASNAAKSLVGLEAFDSSFVIDRRWVRDGVDATNDNYSEVREIIAA